MDDLTLDAESLFAIADVIDGYCAKQRETINVYYAQIMALESEWRDDETFGGIAEEIRTLKNKAITVLDEIYSTYPKYFRKKAQHILERPIMNGGSSETIRVEEVRVPPNISSYGGYISPMTRGSIDYSNFSGLNNSGGATGTYERKGTIPSNSVSANFNTNAQISTVTQRGMDTSFAKKVDFSNYDPKVASAVVQSMELAKKDFPNLQINYFGSISNQVSNIHSELVQSRIEYLREKHGDAFTDAEYLELGNMYADELISKWKMNDIGRTIAWSLKIPKSADPTNGRLDKYCGIAINDIYANDNDAFTEKKVAEVASKHKPLGCDTPKATADHEIGHEIDRMLSARNDEKIIALYEDFLDNDNPEDYLSGYAQTNIAEFIAEAYSEYRNNPNPRTYAVKVYNRLLELQSKEDIIK